MHLFAYYWYGEDVYLASTCLLACYCCGENSLASKHLSACYHHDQDVNLVSTYLFACYHHGEDINLANTYLFACYHHGEDVTLNVHLFACYCYSEDVNKVFATFCYGKALT